MSSKKLWSCIEGIGNSVILEFPFYLADFEYTYMEELRNRIVAYAYMYQGDWNKIGQALRDHEPYKKIECPYPFVTRFDKAYPVVFQHLRYPPWILFYQGNLSLCDTACVGIVGSRDCSKEALENTKVITHILKQKYTIVSGLAKGIDGQSHLCSLDKHTIGIIGCGIDVVYPKCNQYLYEEMRRFHLILSEYPPGVAPYPHHFPWRNRLIAALSSSLIVVEAKYKSGTMLTVNECLALHKPIYCLPTSFGTSSFLGCNYLINQGAYLLGCIEDVEQI